MIARAAVPPAPQIDAVERFQREIASRIPAELIAEVHFFPPIRQGGMESGVAVVAARCPATSDERQDASDERQDASDERDDATDERQDASDERTEAQPIAEAASDDSPYADDAESIAESRAPSAESPTPLERFTVYTAFYRLVLKGPDRGKWEFDAVAEADAPLAAVGAVVRGVQRRSGELQVAELFSGDAFRAVIGWTPPEPPAPIDASLDGEALEASAANPTAS